MFAFLKTIFGGRTAPVQRAAGLAMPRTVYTPAARSAPSRQPAPTPRAQPKRAVAPAPQLAPAAPAHDADGSYGSDVDIPLSSVLRGLPPDLKDRVRDLDIRGATMTISLERILAQLPSGSVRISFGSLRQAAPQLFSIGADSDGRDVALPLDEILSRINPAMLCPPQQVARGPIAEEPIFSSDIFAPSAPAVETPPRNSTLSVPAAPAPGETVDEVPFTPSAPPPRRSSPVEPPRTAPMRVPTPQAANPAQAGAVINANLDSLTEAWPAALRSEIAQWNLPKAEVTLPADAVREGLQRGRIAFTWQTLRSWITPPPPSEASVHDSATLELPLPVITPLFLAAQKQPSKPLQKSAVDEIPDLFFDSRKGEAPKTNGEHDEAPVEPRPTILPAKAAPSNSIAASPVPLPSAPKGPAIQRTPPQAAVPAQETGVIRIPLKDLTGMWSEELRSEIANLDPSHMVALPGEAINAAMKQGKVIFSWGTLRSWIAPELPSVASVDDKTSLELPLAVIMPLFLAGRKQPAKARPQLLDDGIPDPFAEFIEPSPAVQKNGKSEAEPARTERVPDTTSFARKKTATPPKTEAKVEPEAEPPATLPKQSSTPAEVLASAVKLDGVAGALVALSDGFKVASKLPPDMDGDALAAFLPHIFSKVNQSARELRMGDLNNLNFTVDNIPWKIFRVNQIFFAALGHAGQSMPTAELVALAHKLTFKN